MRCPCGPSTATGSPSWRAATARTFAIAVRLCRHRQAQPDRRFIDRGVIENVSVDLGGFPKVSERMRRVGLAKRSGLADKTFCVFQRGEPAPRRVEPV